MDEIPANARKHINDIAISIIYDSVNGINNPGMTISGNKVFEVLKDNGFGRFLSDDGINFIVSFIGLGGHLITADMDEYAGIYFQITDENIENFRAHANDEINPLYKIYKYGKAWRNTALANIFKETHLEHEIVNNFDEASETVPASDRFVDIDHNNPENTKGLEAADDVIAKARESNQFKELFANADDAAIVISEMEYGVNLLKSARVCVKTIQTVLVSRLEWIQAKLPDWAGSASVSQALQWIVKILSE